MEDFAILSSRAYFSDKVLKKLQNEMDFLSAWILHKPWPYHLNKLIAGISLAMKPISIHLGICFMLLLLCLNLQEEMKIIIFLYILLLYY